MIGCPKYGEREEEDDWNNNGWVITRLARGAHTLNVKVHALIISVGHPPDHKECHWLSQVHVHSKQLASHDVRKCKCVAAAPSSRLRLRCFTPPTWIRQSASLYLTYLSGRAPLELLPPAPAPMCTGLADIGYDNSGRSICGEETRGALVDFEASRRIHARGWFSPFCCLFGSLLVPHPFLVWAFGLLRWWLRNRYARSTHGRFERIQRKYREWEPYSSATVWHRRSSD